MCSVRMVLSRGSELRSEADYIHITDYSLLIKLSGGISRQPSMFGSSLHAEK